MDRSDRRREAKQKAKQKSLVEKAKQADPLRDELRKPLGLREGETSMDAFRDAFLVPDKEGVSGTVKRILSVLTMEEVDVSGSSLNILFKDGEGLTLTLEGGPNNNTAAAGMADALVKSVDMLRHVSKELGYVVSVFRAGKERHQIERPDMAGWEKMEGVQFPFGKEGKYKKAFEGGFAADWLKASQDGDMDGVKRAWAKKTYLKEAEGTGDGGPYPYGIWFAFEDTSWGGWLCKDKEEADEMLEYFNSLDD